MAATLVIEVNPVPLSIDENGWVRVTGTRIPLETVIRAHRMGKSPEQIAESFPSLRLADIYLVLGYALSNPESIESYLHDVEHEERRVQEMIEHRPDYVARTERLQSRVRERTGSSDDSARI